MALQTAPFILLIPVSLLVVQCFVGEAPLQHPMLEWAASIAFPCTGCVFWLLP